MFVVQYIDLAYTGNVGGISVLIWQTMHGAGYVYFQVQGVLDTIG